MKRLILMRHAKTEAWHDGLEDHGRALLPRGHADAFAIAEVLKAKNWAPDRVLVSTARRARETWRAMVDVFPGPDVQPIDELYLAGPHTLEECLSAAESASDVLLIAHNPGLHDLACAICRAGGSRDDEATSRLFEKFPTGCAALFEAECDDPYRAAAFELVDVIRPLDLRNDEDDAGLSPFS